MEALADGLLDAALLCRYEAVARPEDKRWDAWFTGQMAKIDSSLDHLEQRWTATLKTRVDLGAIAVACALGYLDFRFADKDWRSSHPTLAAWCAEFCQRPSMQATMPKG